MGSTLRRVMAITWEEFQRTLPIAVGDHPYEIADRCATIRLDGQGEVVMTLGETGERRIASIALPATPVTIEYKGAQEAAFTRFMERFDRYFQRGGG